MTATRRLRNGWPVALLGAAVLIGAAGCSQENILPENENWRTDVVTAISTTQGVSRSEVSVNDVDSGFGHRGPVIYGYAVIPGTNPQPVVDALVANVCKVIGPGTRGIRLNFTLSTHDGPGHELDDYGYEHRSASELCRDS